MSKEEITIHPNASEWHDFQGVGRAKVGDEWAKIGWAYVCPITNEACKASGCKILRNRKDENKLAIVCGGIKGKFGRLLGPKVLIFTNTEK